MIPGSTDVFKFMTLRTPRPGNDKIIHRLYIKDEELSFSESSCGRIYNRKPRNMKESSINAIKSLLNDISSYCAEIDLQAMKEGILNMIIEKNKTVFESVLKDFEIKHEDNGEIDVISNNYFGLNYLSKNNKHYLIPEKLEQLLYTNKKILNHFYKDSNIKNETADTKDKEHKKKMDPEEITKEIQSGINLILSAQIIIEDNLSKFDKKKMLKCLPSILGTNTVCEFVFDNETRNYTEKFNNWKATLFDLLYSLYIIRREKCVSLDYIMNAIRVLYVIEWLAIDDCIERACNKKCWGEFIRIFNKLIDLFKLGKSQNHGTNEKKYGPPTMVTASKSDSDSVIRSLFNKIRLSNCKANLKCCKMEIATVADLHDFYNAIPVIPSYIVRLYSSIEPFNDLKPIGCGDLKVVKQWLLKYEPGEISDIHNIMKGEVKERNHRRFEKTDETISSSSEQSSTTERENQSTERYEIKREVENNLKNDLNLKVDANLSYDGGPIKSSVSGGIASNNSSDNSLKTAANYARDIMSKALNRVENKIRQERSVTTIFEVTEDNKHSFINTGFGTNHISGIYRWVDKRYKSQVFNYGRRLMYELIIPEPSAFYVLSKIKGYEMFDLECVKKPEIEVAEIQIMPLNSPSELTKSKFDELKQKYDLSSIGDYPEITSKRVPLSIVPGGSIGFNAPGERSDGTSTTDISGWNEKYTKTFYFRIEKGYNIKKTILSGSINYHFIDSTNDLEENYNVFILNINGQLLIHRKHTEPLIQIPKGGGLLNGEKLVYINHSIIKEISTNDDGDVRVEIGLQDAKFYKLSIEVEIATKSEILTIFQKTVYDKIKSITDDSNNKKKEKAEMDKKTKELERKEKIEDILKTKIVDIIQGRSEQYNREIIKRELKLGCLSFITKAFDRFGGVASKNPINDNEPISDYEVMTDKKIIASYWDLNYDENSPKDDCGITIEPNTLELNYPVIDLKKAEKKNRYIQFLEQAFEWNQLAYVFYPYFWAYEPKWVEMLNREDFSDPHMTAFLQAGSAKVLLAVTPGYESAVKHFLATRQPWCGGDAPVIDDPMYIALHEEIRKQQDDLYLATPEGEPWEFTVPTSLVYLQDSESKLPDFPQGKKV